MVKMTILLLKLFLYFITYFQLNFNVIISEVILCITLSIRIVADYKGQTFQFIAKLCTNIHTLILAPKPLLFLYIIIVFFLSATCSVLVHYKSLS